jgi:hypothetical protein
MGTPLFQEKPNLFARLADPSAPSRLLQCRDTFPEGFRLHLRGRQGGANVEPDPAQQAAPERPNHGIAIFHTAEK